MTVLTSNGILQEKMTLLFGEEAVITSSKDEITVVIEDKIYNIAFDEEELNSELSLITNKGPFFTVIDGQFNFILRDMNSCLTEIADLNIVGEISNTVRVRIKKDKRAYGLLINNLEFVSNISKLTSGESYTIEDLIGDSIIIGEVTFERGAQYSEDDIDSIIESIRAHLSYSNRIFLENPREKKIKNETQVHINTDELRVNLIKDSEPLTYFLFAESVEHPHLKFLEYYHVLEYYFLHKRIKDVEKVIKNLLAIEMTKVKTTNKEEYYKDLIGLFDSYFKKEDKNTAEIEQLEYVIKSDLGYDVLRHALNNSGINLTIFNEDACEIRGTKITMDKSMFRGTTLLDSQDVDLNDKFCKNLANRIYKVRNFIVHSKKFERDRVFIPNAKNLELLVNEVNLVRVIAYAVLNKSL